ncbi:hypothetical protein, variant [Verruconis gallopava]|nr:hypothetical protein, variant [Verruconis gallopava]KIW07204.1 hypothetical protein, variant [Verruconis gallopava]
MNSPRTQSISETYEDHEQNANSTTVHPAVGQFPQMQTPNSSIGGQNAPPLLTPTSAISNVMDQSINAQPIMEHPVAAINFDLPYDLEDFNDFDTTMGSFLKDIMAPVASSTFEVDDTMMPDVLDFTFDDFMDYPLGILDRSIGSQVVPQTSLQQRSSDNSRSHGPSGTLTPNVRKAADLGQQAFRESMWLWTPGKEDRRTADQAFLTLPSYAITEARSPDAPFPCHLSLATRDRLLACILRFCERDVQRQIVARFPSTELLSAIIETFTAYHGKQVLSWIHLPTLDFEELREELLLSLIASGAARSRHPDVRKLGFAMQETARHAVADMFEEDNRNTRELRAMQTNALHLQVGMWSGIRRKIEIAESFMLPFITMLRRAGRFRRKTGSLPEHSDDPTANEVRWRQWMENESMKRLAFHALYEDTCISISLLSPPLINPLEILLELPCPKDLWEAPSADDWRRVLLANPALSSTRAPTFRSCLADIGFLTNNQALVDAQMSFMLVVCSVWSRVWHWRQMKAMSTISSNTNALPVSSYHQELVNMCKQLSLSDADIQGGIGAHPFLLLEVCQLHLHVSLEDIQLFAGKEGHEEARKTVASLRSWTKLSDARQAIYHAGQILKHASRYPFGFLTGFPAIAVYHASLVLWAYAVLTEPESVLQSCNEASPSLREFELVVLDGEQSPGITQRFLMLGKGRPCIHAYKSHHEPEDGGVTFLTDPMGVMESITNLLASKNGTEYEMPPIVSNLVKLMQSLGKAAHAMKRSKA